MLTALLRGWEQVGGSNWGFGDMVMGTMLGGGGGGWGWEKNCDGWNWGKGDESIALYSCSVLIHSTLVSF